MDRINRCVDEETKNITEKKSKEDQKQNHGSGKRSENLSSKPYSDKFLGF